MKRLWLFLPVLSLLVLIPGCNKHDEFPSHSTYTFENTTDKRLTLDLYGSLADYGSNTNRLLQYYLMPDSSQKVLLEVGKKYWIDWYSDDHSYNNWESDYSGATPPPVLIAAAEDDSRTLTIRNSDTVKSVLLNGGGLSSRWKGAVSSGSGLPGTYEFLFRKDKTGEYTYTDLNGNSTTIQTAYFINGVNYISNKTTRFSLYITKVNSSSVFLANCNFFNFPPGTGRDSLWMVPSGGSSDAFFVRRQ